MPIASIDLRTRTLVIAADALNVRLWESLFSRGTMSSKSFKDIQDREHGSVVSNPCLLGVI